MYKRSQVFAILVVSIAMVAAPALATPSSSMGTIVGAQKAMVGQVSVLDGTSIYDGDRLRTEATGNMRVRFGGSQMVLGGNSDVTLHKTESGSSVTVLRGDVRFASVPGSSLEVRALNRVVIRAKGDQPAIGQLSLINDNAFQIGSTKGDLVVSVNGIDHVVAESTAYRVNLDDANADPQNSRSPRAAGTSGGIWLAIGAITAGTIVALVLGFESPSKP